jgi:hypothetical protein
VIDQPLTITFFADCWATSNRREVLSLKALADRIAVTSAPTKERLPWLKLATFGELRTKKGSLRHDANLKTISGVEIDYDAERILFDDALVIFEKAGLEALLYTSPTHMRDGHGPRWRALCRLSQEYPPEHHERFVCRLAGLFRDGSVTVLSAECWTRSQAYYFGSVDHNPEHRVGLVEGEALDLLDDLDQIALGKPATKNTGPGEPPGGPADEDALLEQIITGKSYHAAAVRLLGVWARRGVAMMKAERRLREAFEAAPLHDQRWADRVADIPRMLGDVWGREAKKADVMEKELADFDARQPPPEEDDHDTGTSWASPLPAEEPWPEMGAEAFHGQAGRIVDALAPHTEADPIALLIHVLVMFGNSVGRRPYYRVGATRHYPVEFGLFAGTTSKGRKGTALNEVEQVFELAAPEWSKNCRHSGLSSGEGLIFLVRDAISEQVRIVKGGKVSYVTGTKDQGVTDKRALICETEFSGTLAVMQREGSILSRVIRELWDCRPSVQSLTKNAQNRVTNPHVSIIGHVTVDELRSQIDRIQMTNGFCNRFLIAAVKRAQLLPFGGQVPTEQLADLGRRLKQSIELAQRWQEIPFTAAGKELWEDIYRELSREQPGLFGAAIARSEAHTARLALLYALLDDRRAIDTNHLASALAVWRFAEASARFVFGDATGNPAADEILRALRCAGPDGMTRTQISDLFGRNRSAERIGAALAFLVTHGKARSVKRGTGGRPVEVWLAC